MCMIFLALVSLNCNGPFQVISHILGSVAENGRPALLIGPTGCGKSHIIKDRLLNNASDVAEVQSLFVNANKFTTSKTLWQRIDQSLEWKHTSTYVPKGNKKLICLIDDINHSNVCLLSLISLCFYRS